MHAVGFCVSCLSPPPCPCSPSSPHGHAAPAPSDASAAGPAIRPGLRPRSAPAGAGPDAGQCWRLSTRRQAAPRRATPGRPAAPRLRDAPCRPLAAQASAAHHSPSLAPGGRCPPPARGAALAGHRAALCPHGAAAGSAVLGHTGGAPRPAPARGVQRSAAPGAGRRPPRPRPGRPTPAGRPRGRAPPGSPRLRGAHALGAAAAVAPGCGRGPPAPAQRGHSRCRRSRPLSRRSPDGAVAGVSGPARRPPPTGWGLRPPQCPAHLHCRWRVNGGCTGGARRAASLAAVTSAASAREIEAPGATPGRARSCTLSEHSGVLRGLSAAVPSSGLPQIGTARSTHSVASNTLRLFVNP
jgi:translation initiation factor IF-2